LRRAVICLVHNALKYARSRVEVRVERGGDGAVRLIVADDGPGFSSDALEHATERFWRDDPARERRIKNGGGTGLGLSIARAIVEASGGTIRLTNGASGGAVVVVELPSA
jgi:signal transduction histidine kinase